MKRTRTFFFALVMITCVIASTSGCERRPRPYAGFKSDKAQEAVNPHSSNQ